MFKPSVDAHLTHPAVTRPSYSSSCDPPTPIACRDELMIEQPSGRDGLCTPDSRSALPLLFHLKFTPTYVHLFIFAIAFLMRNVAYDVLGLRSAYLKNGTFEGTVS